VDPANAGDGSTKRENHSGKMDRIFAPSSLNGRRYRRAAAVERLAREACRWLQGSAAPMVGAGIGSFEVRSPDVVVGKIAKQRRARGARRRRPLEARNALEKCKQRASARETLLERRRRPAPPPSPRLRKIRNPTCPAGFAFPSFIILLTRPAIVNNHRAIGSERFLGNINASRT